MVRIGEGDDQKERCLIAFSRFHPFSGAICDVAGGVLLFRHFGADRLGHGVVMRELFVAPSQRQSLWRVFLSPLKVIAARVKPMTHHRDVFVEAIEGQWHFGVRLVPIRLSLILICVAIQI